MSLIDYLDDANVWIGFYDKKADLGFLREDDAQEMFNYIRQKRYLPVVEKIRRGEPLSVPVKRRIAKVASDKKRIVYTLPNDEAKVLKLLTWMMLRRYDAFFSSRLYSFRPGLCIKTAFDHIVSHKNIGSYFTYKLDIRNYFNSIDVPTLLPILRNLFSDDPQLYDFAQRLLSTPQVMDDGQLVCDQKGVMAGMPTAVFFANVYLTALDRAFEKMKDVIYCRYSDDIIVFAPDRHSLEVSKKLIWEYLDKLHLEVNPDKVTETGPGEKWSFLGFSYCGGQIDVCDISVRKLKAKMRRKARSVVRWKQSNGKEDWMAARAIIKYFDRRLYSSDDPHEINWSRWYFPLINTDRSLKELDDYMQECIRYAATGKRNKSRYDFRYSQMKELGYRTLVNEWYKFKKCVTSQEV